MRSLSQDASEDEYEDSASSGDETGSGEHPTQPHARRLTWSQKEKWKADTVGKSDGDYSSQSEGDLGRTIGDETEAFRRRKRGRLEDVEEDGMTCSPSCYVLLKRRRHFCR